jgi:hypothetical protein
MQMVEFASCAVRPGFGDNRALDSAGPRDCIRLLSHARADARFATQGIAGRAGRLL